MNLSSLVNVNTYLICIIRLNLAETFVNNSELILLNPNFIILSIKILMVNEIIYTII
jgi:hypothetical protein